MVYKLLGKRHLRRTVVLAHGLHLLPSKKSRATQIRATFLAEPSARSLPSDKIGDTDT